MPITDRLPRRQWSAQPLAASAASLIERGNSQKRISNNEYRMSNVEGRTTDQGPIVIITNLIQVAGTIRVWPAGATPVSWDREGRVEWLRSESPDPGVRTGHHVEASFAELGGQTTGSTPADAGAPVFIELPGRKA